MHVRRRRTGLAAATLLGVTLASGLGGPSAQARGRQPASAITASQLSRAGQLMFVSLPGPYLDPVSRLLLTREQLGGVVLFGRNVGTNAQLRSLDSGLHQLAGARGLVVAVDQEGGTVRRIGSAQPVLSAAAAAALGTAGIRSTMTSSGRQLRALGVDVDLAPVADRAGGFLGTRSYGADPGADVTAAVLGLQAGGVSATAKHFPGLGGVSVSTDDAAVRGPAVTAASLAPFAAAVRAGVGLVLVDLAVHPGLGHGPAALQTATYALLRGPRVAFRGPAITDALDAAAVAHLGEVRAAVLALRAGADLVLVPGGPVLDQEVLTAIDAAVRDGTIPVSRYLQALSRAAAFEHGR